MASGWWLVVGGGWVVRAFFWAGSPPPGGNLPVCARLSVGDERGVLASTSQCAGQMRVRVAVVRGSCFGVCCCFLLYVF